MFELIKKQNIVVKIIATLIVLYALTSAIKFIFKQPEMSINDELMKVSSEINKRTPFVVDSMTTLDNVIALPGDKLQYTYTITKLSKDNIDTTILIANAKKNLKETFKSNPQTAYFKENKIDIVINYMYKDGKYVCRALISHNDY